MRFVPLGGGALVASVRVSNRDMGFVAVGQPAVVKLSADAVNAQAAARASAKAEAASAAAGAAQGNPQAQPSYTATIPLDSHAMLVDGQTVRPTPRMTVTVDIRTGERRVAEFLLEPVLQYAAEGLRER